MFTLLFDEPRHLMPRRAAGKGNDGKYGRLWITPTMRRPTGGPGRPGHKPAGRVSAGSLCLARFFRGFLARRGVPAAARKLACTGDHDAMTNRSITVAAAQLGPIQRAEPRSVAVARMIRLLEQAHRRGVELVVFPELALTTFFPRHFEETVAAADHWFETAMPSNETAPLFDTARRLGIGFHLGFAEISEETNSTGQLRKRHFNTAIMVSPQGEILLKYRKIHLPGHAEFDPRLVRRSIWRSGISRSATSVSRSSARQWAVSTGSTWG